MNQIIVAFDAGFSFCILLVNQQRIRSGPVDRLLHMAALAGGRILRLEPPASSKGRLPMRSAISPPTMRPPDATSAEISMMLPMTVIDTLSCVCRYRLTNGMAAPNPTATIN